MKSPPPQSFTDRLRRDSEMRTIGMGQMSEMAENEHHLRYAYDANALFSIDGERYRAQKLTARVMKEIVPIHY